MQTAIVNNNSEIIDCSSSPLDLDTPADRILKTINKRLETLPKDQTLYVFMGEHHFRPTNIILFNAVANAIQAEGHKLGISLEKPYDTLFNFTQVQIPSVKPEIKEALLKKDTNNKFSLKSNYLASCLLSAPISTKNHLIDLIKSKAQINLHDLRITQSVIGDSVEEAFEQSKLLNQEDDLTRTLIANETPELLKLPIYAGGDPIGMRLRNIFAAQSIQKFTKETSSRIVLIRSGKKHLFGSEKYPFSEGLCSIFENTNLQSLAIYNSTTTNNNISEEALNYLHSNSVINIIGLENREYYYLPNTEEASELAFLQKISAASNGIIKIYDHNKYEELYKKQVTFSVLKQRIKQAKTDTKNTAKLQRRQVTAPK